MNLQVEALSGFDHSGRRKIGDRFTVPKRTAEQLARKGLVRIVSNDPEPAAGTPSSASPVAPASQQTTVNESASGDSEQAQESAPTNQTGRRKSKRKNAQ